MRLSRLRRQVTLESLETRQLLAASSWSDESIAVSAASEVDDIRGSADPGDSLLTAAPIGVVHQTVTRTGSVGPLDRTDFYEFQVVENVTVNIVLFGLQADATLGLLDARGKVLAYSAEPGPRNEQTSQLLAPGHYFVLVLSAAETTSQYQFAISAYPLTGNEPIGNQPDIGGNAFGRATPLGELNSSIALRDRVGGQDPADVFQIDLARNQEVAFQLDQLTADVDLHIVTLDGKLAGRSRHEGVTSESLRLSLLKGRYNVLLFPVDANSSDYRLQIQTMSGSAISVNPPPLDGGDTFSRATDIGTLASTWQRRESIGGADTTDVFRFQLKTSSSVRFDLTDLQSDIDLYVFDADYRMVARQYQSHANSEYINPYLAAGTFYALVIPHGEESSDYLLRLQLVNSAPPPPPPPTAELPLPLPDVPDYGDGHNWNVNSINAPEAWAYGYTGKGVVVAVIDSGVDRSHPDLQANMWKNSNEIPGDGVDNDENGYVDDVFGWNFVNDNANVADLTGHGTHVAGIVAAARNEFGMTGVAYHAKLMPLRVLDANGSGRTGNVSSAIRYAADNGADIITLSLFSDGYSAGIYNALAYARERGVFVVAAAGNDGRNEPNHPARHSADLTNVLSVGAYNQGGVVAGFSNRVGSSKAIQIDAPGVNIYSTLPNNGYGDWYGTSMATPHVAGVAALVWSANRKLTAEQVRFALVQMANRRVDRSDSRGGLNAANSVPLVVNSRIINPTLSVPEPVVPMPVVENIAVHAASRPSAAQRPRLWWITAHESDSTERRKRRCEFGSGNDLSLSQPPAVALTAIAVDQSFDSVHGQSLELDANV